MSGNDYLNETNGRPIFIPVEKLVRPAWAEVKADLEHSDSVSFQDMFFMRRVTKYITTENCRSYVRKVYIMVSPYRINSRTPASEVFSYDEFGYCKAFDYGVALIDDDKALAVTVSQENARMRTLALREVKKLDAQHKEKKTKYYSEDFLAYKKECIDYARTLGTKESILEGVLTDEFTPVFYLYYKRKINYMDVAMDLYKGGLTATQIPDGVTDPERAYKKRGRKTKRGRPRKVNSEDVESMGEKETNDSEE